MSQTLVRFLPMAGSSLWQSVIRSGDGTKLFLRKLFIVCDHWLSGYPHPFSFYTVTCCGRFAHLKRGTGGGSCIFNSFWWDTDKKHPLWCLGSRTLQVFYQNSTDFSLNWLCVDLTHIGRARREMVKPVPVLCRVWWAISHACLSLLRLPTLQRGWALVSQKV